MWLYVAKVALTALIVVAVTEVAKRSTLWAAVLASLPLTSLLSFVWIYVESGDTRQIAAMADGILWLVLPGLAFFVLLPLLIRGGASFWASLGIASAGTVAAYLVTLRLLGQKGDGPI